MRVSTQEGHLPRVVPARPSVMSNGDLGRRSFAASDRVAVEPWPLAGRRGRGHGRPVSTAAFSIRSRRIGQLRVGLRAKSCTLHTARPEAPMTRKLIAELI